MLERDGYPPGVPCWVDTGQPDPEAAVGFYGDLFGWEFTDRMAAGSPGRYFVAQLRGRDVAAVGSQPGAAPPTPVWNTYIWVDGTDDVVARVKNAGGSALMEPFDVLDAGRMGVFSDPSGAVFRVWQANKTDDVSEQFDAMSRLWDPRTQGGLVRRRHNEATLWRSGFTALQLA